MRGTITLHTSNRLELLADRLAAQMARPLSNPLAQEVIVVQSRGMERWLAMALAGRLGVWANCRYPFPNALAWEAFRAVLPEIPEENPLAPERTAWRLMELIPPLIGEPAFLPLAHYLADDPGGLKLYQLASQVADLFDQYTLFRPEMLDGWETGRDCDRCRWQAILWRLLVGRAGGRHRGSLLREFCRTMAGSAPLPASLPERIAVFGIPALPRYHSEILSALAGRTEVHLFLLNPCSEHWFQIVSEGEKSRRLVHSTLAGSDAYLESGNPLLASLGRQGRDFFDLLYDSAPLDEGEGGSFVAPEGDGLLHRLQGDILSLVDATERRAERPQIAPDDCSLQIHSCHSPLREIEVLHDRLLALFEAHPGLTPRDVVVMIPRIDEYAPYISAVFGGGEERRSIPFSIADRSVTGAGSLVRAFLALLDLAESRCGASQVLDLLAHPAIARRFELSVDDLATVRRWVTESGIRWGVDGEDRGREGLPPFAENSWRAGLERLLLGYALPGAGLTLYRDILPYDDLEGSEARLLGGLVAFTDALFGLKEAFARPRRPQEWAAYLRTLLERFFSVDDRLLGEQTQLTAAFAELGRATEAGFTGSIGPAVVRSWLNRQLERDKGLHGFLGGGVTFCAMLPMRSIPFRVVALVGMNDGLFPRQNRPPGFDLMAAAPRRGDRSIRDEDRYLFLEAILSARDCLYLGYVGQSSRDNGILPPSVLVSELLDYVERSSMVAGVPEAGQREAVRQRLVTRHHLHPFHPAYFREGAGRLFSYSAENCRAAQTRQQGGEPAGFLDGLPLPLPADLPETIPLERLIAFLRSPAEHFLRNRLGIRLERVAAPMEDREPFAVDGLDDYLLANELVEQLLAGNDADRLGPVFRGRGLLPPGGQGRVAFGKLRSRAEQFTRQVAPLVAQEPLHPLDAALPVGSRLLAGRIDGIRPAGLVRYRCARLKARDLLSLWVEHLVLNAVAPAGYPLRSRLVMRDASRSFAPVPGAAELLAALAELYLQGLCAPLPFFPETSLALCLHPDRPVKAVAVWSGSSHSRGEGEDPAFDRCFGRIDPAGICTSPGCGELAMAIYGPLLACLEEGA